MNTKVTARPTTRIYEVSTNGEAGPVTHFLIDAKSAQAAEQHVSRKFVNEASIASAKRIAELMGEPSKVKVEDAQVTE